MNNTVEREVKKVKNTNKYIYLLALIPFIAIVLLYELIPLVNLIIDSFGLDSDRTVLFCLDNYKKIFSTLSYQKAITNSLKITFYSTAAGILLAFLGAKSAHTSRGKLRTLFMTILNMTSNFAGVPLAFAYMILLGNFGVITQLANIYGIEFIQNFDLYSSKGLILMYIYFQIPLSTLLLIPAFNGIKKEWQEANMLLGGKEFTFWFKVGIPVLIPSIFGTISVLFANALCAYATAYALLMNNFNLIPVNISAMFVGDITSKPKLGAALSVVMMVLMCAVILIDNYIVKKTTSWKTR